MSEWPKVSDIDITINTDDLLGPLGYKTAADVPPSIMHTITEEVERCRGMIEGKSIHALMEFKHIDGANAIHVNGLTIEDGYLVSLLDGSTAFAIAVCTIGPTIDKFIDGCFGKGDFLTGMIADVIGNRAVENVSHTCARLICMEASELKLSMLPQMSPGYGKWDTSGQRPLFSMLNPSPIGVSLNEYCMMEPKKSVSFIIPLTDSESHYEEVSPCHGCGFKNCSYRRT